MANKKTLKVNILSQSSIKNLQKELQSYANDLNKMCEEYIKALAQTGIEVGQQSVGGFGKYITFSMKLERTTDKCTAIVYVTETGTITSKWQTKDGIKTADVSPLLMAEFGSGWRAENPMEIEGVGQGTFPGQTHAFDKDGWYWRDENNVLHHSYGITPTQPVFKAYKQMETELIEKAKEIFGK